MRRVAFLSSAAAVVLAGLIVMTAAAPAGAVTKAQLKAKALSLLNFPTGWSVDNSATGGVTNLGGCLQALAALKKPVKGLVRAEVRYDNATVPALQETLESGKGAVARYDKYTGTVARCKRVSLTASNGTKISGSVGAMSFPTMGDSSRAFQMNLSAQGVSVGIDLVFFKAGSIDGDVLYEDFSPDPSTVQAYLTEAVNKIQGKPTTTPTTF